MVATTDSGVVVVAASSGSQVAVSPELPDSPQQQSSSRAEGEGRGGLTAAAVHSSALAAVSSVYARVTESDPARVPTPTSSTAAAAAAAAGDGEPPPTRRGGMARPGAAKGVRVASWSDEVTGGGPAAHGAGGDGGDGSGGRDDGLGSGAEELLRMVDEAFLLAKRSHESETALDALRRQCNDATAAEVSTSDAAAAGAAGDPAAEAGGQSGELELLSSSVTPRVITPRGGTRPQLDAEGVARVDSYKQAGRQHLKPRVPPPPAPRANTAPHPAPTLPDRAAFFAPRAPPTSRGAPSRAPRPQPPPDMGALEILPRLSAPSPSTPPTAARADDLSARDARPTTSPPSVASPRAHYDFDFVVGLHDQAA